MPIDTRSDKIYLSSEKKTEEVANKFLEKINRGHIIFFHGEMGVGKTTFIRYLINGFQKKIGINLTEVTSPTFNLMNEYQIKTLNIKHFDLFRLKSQTEIKGLDLFEANRDSITLIEWPQIIKKKPKNLIELFFKYGEDHQKRSLQIKGLDLKF